MNQSTTFSDAHAAELLELGDALVELDPQWRVVRVNRTQETLFNRPRAETLGQVFWELWPDVAGLTEACHFPLTHCMEQRVAVQCEAHFAAIGLWTNITAYPVSSGGLALFLRDISAAKASELELAASQALVESERNRLQAIIDTIPTGLIMLNEQGGMVLENAEWKRTWAGNAVLDTVIDYDAYKGYWPDTGARLSTEEWPCAVSLLQGLQTRDVVIDIERFNGTRGTIVVSSAPLRDSSGRVVGAVAANMDISELRAAQAQLQESDRREDDFLGMLSHELRNPLAPILNSLYVLDRVEPTGQQAKLARGVIGRQVAHLRRLVDDLLDVTRIGRGKITLKRTNLDLVDLARRAVEDYRDLADERGLNIVLAAPHRAITINGDETRLAQVLANLLSNSIKFTPSGGELKVEVQSTSDTAVLSVSDTGVGIASDLIPAIFDPFTQAQQSSARSEGGLGLGLALVKGLVELHGGTINVQSSPGAGTSFSIELAVIRDAQSVTAPPASEPTNGVVYRVLIVDDNVDAAEALAQLVTLLGHRTEVVFDGRSAVAAALARPPDLVLCDIGLPDIDGYAVASQLREKLPRSTRLVAVSGYARPEDVRKATEAGFSAHIAKPAALERIESLLDQGSSLH